MATVSNALTTKEVALVINLRSRSGELASQSALREMERQGIRVVRNRLVRSGPELMLAVRGAIESGIETVVVGGGDGTISAVVDLFANRPDLTLGVLPVGTGNEVARILGIPLDLAGACRVIAYGHPATIDLAEANGNFFLHTGLIGYPARVNHTIPPWLKLHFGKAAYLYTLLVSLFASKPFHTVVTAGDVRWEGDTVLVIVGNGSFHRPGQILLSASETGRRGMLVYTPRDSRWSTLVRLAIGLWITHTAQPSLLLSTVTDEVSIEADPPQTVDLDGEFARLTPVGFRLSPAAIRVLVPNRLAHHLPLQLP